MENIRDGLCGRMCREQCQAQKDRILGQSLKKSAKSKMKPYIFLCLRRNGQQPEKLWEMIIPLPIEYSMRNTSESLKDAEESFLSQILQENVPEKYYLSQRACSGILRRASARGKELPELLEIPAIALLIAVESFVATALSNALIDASLPPAVPTSITSSAFW